MSGNNQTNTDLSALTGIAFIPSTDGITGTATNNQAVLQPLQLQHVVGFMPDVQDNFLTLLRRF